VQRWSHLVPVQGQVLDVASGFGRHLQWFAQRGHPVTGIDRNEQAVAATRQWGEVLLADIENHPWPLLQNGQPRQFAAVVVTNYLWRPLLPTLLHSLAIGGVLLYETFAQGNEDYGKPSRPEFLLQPGELLQHCAGLHVVAYETGFEAVPARVVQRIAAIRPGPESLSRMPHYPI
jgi:SAM-dependent methyltransferase